MVGRTFGVALVGVGLAVRVGVGTHEPRRPRGVAAARTSAAVRTAFGRGLAVVFLTTADPGARRVYERVGFRPAATVRAYAGPR